MRAVLVVLLWATAMGAAPEANQEGRSEDISSPPLEVTAPFIVSVSTSISTSVSSSNEPATSTASPPHLTHSSGDELEAEGSTKHKLYKSPKLKTSSSSQDSLSASARLRQKLFGRETGSPKTTDAKLNLKARRENFKSGKTSGLQNGSKPGNTSTGSPSSTVAPRKHPHKVNSVSSALLVKEIASLRGIEHHEEENDETPDSNTKKIPSIIPHSRIPRKQKSSESDVKSSVTDGKPTVTDGKRTVSDAKSSVTDVAYEGRARESPAQRATTTFSDLIKERFPDSRPPTIVKLIEPAFKSVIRPEFSPEDLALYGKELSIQKATLEKEILNFRGPEKQVFRVRTIEPLKKEYNEIAAKKIAFKKRDIEDMPKKWMQVVKHHDARWVAEKEEGVMLPAADGSGIAFVPEILIEDTEFLLSKSLKLNARRQVKKQSPGAPAGPLHTHLNRPGRDAHEIGGVPYSFGYIVEDEHTDNYQTRYEEGDVNGVVNGCYQVLEPTGLVRTVTYRADITGFTVLSVTENPDKSPCPGLDLAGQFSALSASAAHGLNTSPKTLSSQSTSASTAQHKRIQSSTRNVKLPTGEMSDSLLLSRTKSSPQSGIHVRGRDNSFRNDDHVSSGSFKQDTRHQLSSIQISGLRDQIDTKGRNHPFQALNSRENKPSSSHISGTNGPNLLHKSNFESQQQRTRALLSHVHRNIRHGQNLVKTPTIIQPVQREHDSDFGRKQPIIVNQNLQSFARPQSSLTPKLQPSIGVNGASHINEQGSISEKQAALSKYLQSLSDELYSSFSESGLASAASSDNLIHFPFVLIPVSTFIDLQKEGHINGDVQSFGAFIKPVQNSFSSQNFGNQQEAGQSPSSHRSRTLRGNKISSLLQSSEQPTFTRLPNLNTNQRNDVPQILNSHSASHRSTRGSRTVLQEKPRPHPVTSYPKITSIPHPTLPSKVSLSPRSVEDTFNAQEKQREKIIQIKKLYDHFSRNDTDGIRNTFNENFRDSLTKPITPLSFSFSQSSLFPGLDDSEVFVLQRDLNKSRNSPKIAVNDIPFKALSAFVKTSEDIDLENADGAPATLSQEEASPSLPQRHSNEITQNLQSKQKPHFDVTYTHIPKGKPPLPNYGYLNPESLKSTIFKNYLPLAPPSSVIHGPEISALPALNIIEKGSPEPRLISGNPKTVAGKLSSNVRAPVSAYLASLSEPSLKLGKSLSSRSRGTKRASDQIRRPRTLDFNNFENDIQIPASAGKFKPPTKLESMIDSPLIRSSDWIPMLPTPRQKFRPDTQRGKGRSLSDNTSKIGEKFTLPVTSKGRSTSQSTRTTRDGAGSSLRTTGPRSNISFSFPRTSPPTSSSSSFLSDFSSKPTSSSTAPEFEFSLPFTSTAFRFTTETPFSSERHVPHSEIELDAHETDGSFRTIFDGRSVQHSFDSPGFGGSGVPVTNAKNEGFGKFHTRESSKKIDPIDGSEFNSHFFSQVN